MDLEEHNLSSLQVYDQILCFHLCTQHTSEFVKWWNPDKYDWEDSSWSLVQFCSDYFHAWWNPDRFNWKGSTWSLIQYRSRQLPEWWDSNKFNWQEDSYALAKFCTHYLHIWWDSNKFNWEKGSSALVRYCTRYFDTWWDPSKFDWSKSWALACFCPEYFDKWWNPDKFSYSSTSIQELVRNLPGKIDKWFNAQRIMSTLNVYNRTHTSLINDLLEILPLDKRIELLKECIRFHFPVEQLNVSRDLINKASIILSLE